MKIKLTVILGLLFLITQGATTQYFDNYTPFIDWSPDGKLLAVGFRNEVKILDAETLEVLNIFNDLAEQQTEALWSPDSSLLAIANADTVEFWQNAWDGSTAEHVLSYPPTKPPAEEYSPSIRAMAWSPDQTHFVLSSAYHVEFIQLSDATLVYDAYQGWGQVNELVWDDTNKIAVANSESLIVILDGDSGEGISGHYWTYSGAFPPGINDVDFSPNGLELAIGFGDGANLIWKDVNVPGQDAEFRWLQGHNEGVDGVSWSPDGKYILTSSADGTINLSYAANGQRRDRILVERDVHVASVDWRPDSQRFVYGNLDGSLILKEIDCGITASVSTTLFIKPAIDSLVTGNVAINQELIATGQFKADDGYIWWRLDTTEWIREDFVSEDTDCAMLVEVDVNNFVEQFLAKECFVTTTQAVVIRSRPRSDSNPRGTVETGIELKARNTWNEEGFVWYWTTDGWIRGDLVAAEADCSRLESVDIYQAYPDGAAEPPSCKLTALRDLNVREYPDENAEITKTYASGATLFAYNYHINPDGQQWWDVPYGWVRADLVTADACPSVEPFTVTLTPRAIVTPTPQPTLVSCQITALQGTTFRGAPNHESGSSGEAVAGEILFAVRQVTDEAGFIWWGMQYYGWIHEDSVIESEACYSLPVYENPQR